MGKINNYLNHIFIINNRTITPPVIQRHLLENPVW